MTLQPAQYAPIASHYNVHLYAPPAPRISTGALSPALSSGRVEKDYLAKDPGLVIIDSVLSVEALESLQRFAEEATVWHEVKDGYLVRFLLKNLRFLSKNVDFRLKNVVFIMQRARISTRA